MPARFEMAVVEAGSPLTIKLESSPTKVVAAEDFVGGLATDDRVQAAFLGDRLTVLAKAGGSLTGRLVYVVERQATQSVTEWTDTPVEADTVLNDFFQVYDPAYKSRFTPTVAGWYDMRGTYTFGGDTNGFRVSRWWKNGTAVGADVSPLNANSFFGGYVRAQHQHAIYLNGSTDYVEFIVYSSVTLNTNSAPAPPRVEAYYVGP